MIFDHFGTDNYAKSHEKNKLKQFIVYHLDKNISNNIRGDIDKLQVAPIKGFNNKNGLHTIFYFEFLGDKINNRFSTAVRLLPCYCPFCMSLNRDEIKAFDVSKCKSKEEWSFCVVRNVKKRVRNVQLPNEPDPEQLILENNITIDAENIQDEDENKNETIDTCNYDVEVITSTGKPFIDTLIEHSRSGRRRSLKVLEGSNNFEECQCRCGQVIPYDETKKCWICQRRLLASCWHRQWKCWYCIKNFNGTENIPGETTNEIDE